VPAHDVLSELWDVISDRVENPRDGSYISSLLRDPKGNDRVLEKVGEEFTEYLIAVRTGRDRTSSLRRPISSSTCLSV